VTAIRAWCGKALVHCQQKDFANSVDCMQRALNADESDPSPWLLYSSMLARAERRGEAEAAVDMAYKAYVAAGRPSGLDHVFSELSEH